MKLQNAIIYMCIFFAISTIICLSEGCYSHKNIDDARGMGGMIYISIGYRNTFYVFNIGDGEFSGIEQLIAIMFSILGVCALSEILEKVEK